MMSALSSKVGLLLLTVTAAVCSPAPAPTPPEPKAELRNLCDLEDGRFCDACGGPGEAECPQGDQGALCCSGDVCVVWSGSTCSGTLGYCYNYTTSRDPATGVEQATCHDDR